MKLSYALASPNHTVKASLAALGCALAVALVSGMTAQAASLGFNPPKAYYMALGDSLTFGYQQIKFDTEFPNVDPATFDTGFANDFANRLAVARPGITTVNLGCPGESTASFISGPCAYEAEGLPLHVPYGGSQLSAALGFLRAHPGQVSPITISLGANDLQACAPSDVSCISSEIAAVGANLNTILTDLQNASPSSEIIILQYYNPYAVVFPSTNAFTVALNTTIGNVAVAQGARVADAFSPFNLAAQEPQTLCALTFFCTYRQDIHPTDLGYSVIGDQFWAASDYDRLLS